MKKMVLTSLHKMEMVDAPMPKISGPHDVLLKMSCVGVCGSDVHYYKTGKIGSQVVKYPFAVGHEGSAVVAEVGSSVTRVKPGDRIAIEPAQPCHQCDQCLAGRENTCRKMVFLGCPGQVEGNLVEYIVMPDECCFPIPSSMSMIDAALVEPLSIGFYAVKSAGRLKGKSIGILGSGPIGFSCLLPAKAQGASKVFMTDLIDSRLDLAKKQGADWTGNAGKIDVVKEVSQLAPLGLDVIFECAGQQETVDQSMELLSPGGTLMMIGIPEVDRISFAIDKGRRKELRIQNVRRQNHCVQPALDAIANGAINPGFMATHRFSFDQTKEAFDLVESYRDGVIKAMIEF